MRFAQVWDGRGNENNQIEAKRSVAAAAQGRECDRCICGTGGAVLLRVTHPRGPIMSTTDRKGSPSAAERMRIHRKRHRNGLQCVRLLLHETEIDGLVRRGLLKPERRRDRSAVETAIAV